MADRCVVHPDDRLDDRLLAHLLVVVHNAQPRGADSVELSEVGPRFELKLYQIKLGTMDQQEADTEYVLRSFSNTAKKRRML